VRLDTPAAAPPLHGCLGVQGRACGWSMHVHGSLVTQHCEASARREASAAARPEGPWLTRVLLAWVHVPRTRKLRQM